jgi:hypothetical protein
MKILNNDLYCQTEVWDDPGDYPNAVAGYPLPSETYCDFGGVFEFEAENEDEIKELEDPNDMVYDWVYEECEIERGCSLDLDIQVEGNRCVVTIVSAEYEPDEPDYD